MKKQFIPCALALTLLFTNCATIVSGSMQDVKFMSSPSAATIFVDNIEVGKTPFETKLQRKKQHEVMIKLEGYKTYQVTLSKKFNGWYIGNLLFGGLVGLIIDPITGAMYKLSPNEINAQMAKSTAYNYKKGDVYVTVALEIDPTWKKVGQLEKINN